MSEFDLKHALTVANEFEYGSEKWLVALLHDSIEDGALTFEELSELVGEPFTAVDVDWLTRRPHESYTNYIEMIRKRRVPTLVKIADLKANLARMDPKHESLRKRYEEALKVLEGIYGDA